MKRLILSFVVILFFAVASAQQAPDYSAYILTPKSPEIPNINGPRVYGASPGADFLYRLSPGVTDRKMEGKWWEIR